MTKAMTKKTSNNKYKKDRKIRIAVLVSGGGTNLQAILDAVKAKKIISGSIELVAGFNPNAFAFERAKKNGIETYCAADEADLLNALETRCIEFVVLAGFIKILSSDFVSHYKNRIINVHPALIPSFCGKGCYGLHVHEKALEKGVKVTGATVHFVNEEPDAGKIIAQKAVLVEDGDTPESLQRRVMEEAEWQILPQTIEAVCQKILNGES